MPPWAPGFVPGRAGHLVTARPYDPLALRRAVAALSGTQTAYDSVTASANPSGAPIYYGYVNGAYANLQAVQALFPNAVVLGISVDPTQAADELDCEPGNCTPADCPTFWKAARAAGIEIPSIYCPASWTTQVRQALATVTTSTDQYFLRSAHYGLGRHICGACGYPAADDTQWTDEGAYDISEIGARHVTYLFPPTPPTPTEDDDMKLVHWTTGEADTDGCAYTASPGDPAGSGTLIKLPAGTTECASCFVRVKRRGAAPVGDGPNLVANPVDGPPKGYCIIRVTGLAPGDRASGTAGFQ